MKLKISRTVQIIASNVKGISLARPLEIGFKIRIATKRFDILIITERRIVWHYKTKELTIRHKMHL
jgi:hypothetical protein